MGAVKSLLGILFVAVVIGAALSVIFWPLMKFERAMGNQKEYNIWIAEWVAADVLLTLVLCRQEIRALFRQLWRKSNQDTTAR